MFALTGTAMLLRAVYGNPGAIYYPYPFDFSFYAFWPMVGIFFSMWAVASFVFWPWRVRYVYGGRRWRYLESN